MMGPLMPPSPVRHGGALPPPLTAPSARIAAVTQARLRALQGAALAIGAPLGWFLLRWLGGEAPIIELTDNLGLYLYLLIPTTLVMTSFGALIGIHEDRVERARHQLEELSLTDAITGLRNVRYFQQRLSEEYAAADRHEGHLAIAVIDLDHFKAINDRFGHQVGDDLLAAIGRAILSIARKGETCARVGGEEFAVLLPGDNGETAAKAGERILKAIRRAQVRGEDGGWAGVTASVGVASTAELADVEPDLLYWAADKALYRAKREGRDRVVQALSSDFDANRRANLGDAPNLARRRH